MEWALGLRALAAWDGRRRQAWQRVRMVLHRLTQQTPLLAPVSMELPERPASREEFSSPIEPSQKV